MKKIFNIFALKLFRKKWRKLNSHNYTTANTQFDMSKVVVKKGSYGPLNVYEWGLPCEKLFIGSYVSIARNVSFVLGGNHYSQSLSTYPFNRMILDKSDEPVLYSKGPITVKDDVWIGMNSTVLSGVEIGQGAIIGAGSVVAKNIPPYAIVAGNPARVIKYRFSEDIIKKLLTVDYAKVDLKFINDNIDVIYKNISPNSIEDISQEMVHQ